MRLGFFNKFSQISQTVLIIGLASALVSCEVVSNRDISMSGARELFKKRLMANQMSEEEKKHQQEIAMEAQAQNMRNRRRTLQIRVPANFEFAGLNSFNSVAPHGMGNFSVQQTYLQAAQALKIKQRALHLNQTELDVSDNDHMKIVALDEQEYLFEIEKILLDEILRLESEIKTAEQSVAIGTANKASVEAAILFGRNKMAARDEMVDLQNSFFFVGNDIVTGVSLGRMNGLDGQISSREMSVNFNGLALPAAIQSLAQSINLSIFLSPDLRRAKEKVYLKVARNDVLDIIDVLIDAHNIALAYDRDMGIARFYTREEFQLRVEQAATFAASHNSQASVYQNIQSLEHQRQELYDLYRRYFNNPGEKARMKTIRAHLIMDEALSIEVPKVLVQLKQLAISRQKMLNNAKAHETQKRQLLLDEIFTLKHEIEFLKISADNAKANLEKNKAGVFDNDTPSGRYSGAGSMSSQQMLQKERSRVSIVRDSSLATTEPIYTESLTVFYQESSYIKEALGTYFNQIYPQTRTPQSPAETPATSSEPEQETAKARQTAQANPARAQTSAQIGGNARSLDNRFRPPKIDSNKTSIIITGMKTDIDLAHQLINDLDIPAKQVLVEVFMVNVARNWQRKLEIQIASVLDAIKPEGRALEFISNVAHEAQNNRISIMPDRSGSIETLIDFIEVNNIGRTISSPTILAKDKIAATINRTVTRFREVTTQVPTGTLNADGIPVTSTQTTFEPIEATLTLGVTPTINVLNDHVELQINFEDSSFIDDDANSPQLSNNISTTLNAAPGDVIVLAGLYKESNKRDRETLPGLSGIPLLGVLLGGSIDDQLQSDELVIFLAPTVITPQTGIVPANAVR